MDIKLGIFMLQNMAPPQVLVLAPGTIIRGNTVVMLGIQVPDITKMMNSDISTWSWEGFAAK